MFRYFTKKNLYIFPSIVKVLCSSAFRDWWLNLWSISYVRRRHHHANSNVYRSKRKEKVSAYRRRWAMECVGCCWIQLLNLGSILLLFDYSWKAEMYETRMFTGRLGDSRSKLSDDTLVRLVTLFGDMRSRCSNSNSIVVAGAVQRTRLPHQKGTSSTATVHNETGLCFRHWNGQNSLFTWARDWLVSWRL